MNLLFFIGSLNGVGGVENTTINLLNSLSMKENIKITVALFQEFNNKQFNLSNNVKVNNLCIENYKKDYFKVLRKLDKILKSEKFDVFITIETMSLVFSLIPGLINCKTTKLVVWEHFNFRNDNGKKIRGVMRKLAAKYCDLIILLTKRDVQEWQRNLNIRGQVIHIYNMTPFEVNDTSYSINSKTIISVGRYSAIKGFERLIRIWYEFQHKYEHLDWKLEIIGYGEEKEKLQRLIDSLDVKNIYLRTSNSIQEDYQNASFYCMTSYFEGLPIVLIEAQSYGLPIIAFNIYTGPEEIIIDKSGFLIEDNEFNDYVDAIHKMVSDIELRTEMHLSAFNLSKRFKRETIINRWIQELEKITL